VFSSKICAGSIADSLLSNVAAATVHCDGAIIVNCATGQSIRAGKGSILYNVMDEAGAGIVAGDGEVVVGVTDETGASFLLRSHVEVDGGAAWKETLGANAASFEEVHRKNLNANIGEITARRQEKFDAIAAAL
jgi:hypothetical protein